MSMDSTPSDREAKTEDVVEIVTRDGTKDDHSFIYATFLRALYYDNDWFGLIPKDIYMKHYHDVVEHLLTHCTIRIACLKSDPDVILGYALFTLPHTLHFMFCKLAWRNAGVAHLLLKGVQVHTITHVTNQAVKILTHQQSEWQFNPFAINESRPL